MSPAGPVLVIGATSDIGRAIARAYAGAGRSIILAARHIEAVELDVADFKLRFAVDSFAITCDVLVDDPSIFFDSLPEQPTTVVCVVGLMGEPPGCERGLSGLRVVMETNYVGPALLLSEAARRLSAAGGVIVGISSVAGDRGRASNYVYGSAKAGFTAFLSGLRARFASSSLRVLTVKPGFVRTRITRGMSLPPLLTASPEEVAEAVLRADQRGQDVVYVRRVWWLIMRIVRSIPEPIFKRLRF